MNISVTNPILLNTILLLPATVNKLFKKLHLVNNYINMFPMDSENLSTTNSIITRQLFLDDW